MTTPITALLPYAGQEHTRDTVERLLSTGLIRRVYLLAAQADMAPVPGAQLVAVPSLYSMSALRRVAAKAVTPYTLLCVHDVPLDLGQFALERFLAVAEATGAGLVYSDYYEIRNDARTAHPPIDYQAGSLRDDFDFGSMLVYRSELVKQALRDLGKARYAYSALYALRLAVSRRAPVTRIGEADAVIGADRYVGWTGRAYVYTGSTSGLSATPFFTATGQDYNNHFGFSVGTAGDVNGDGYDDIIVGAYHYVDFTGRAYVYAGGANGMTVIFTATGENRGDYFGRSVGTAGDINGDDYTDAIIGAPHHGNYAGRVYVYAGGPGGLNPMPIFTVTGEDVGNTFGSSLGTAGDVNGDGYTDVIVGAPGYKDTGRAYVFTGLKTISGSPTGKPSRYGIRRRRMNALL